MDKQFFCDTDSNLNLTLARQQAQYLWHKLTRDAQSAALAK